jgi:hypothetical protein
MPSTQVPCPPSTLLEDMSRYRSDLDRWLKRFSDVRVEVRLPDFATRQEPCPHCGQIADRHQVVERGPKFEANGLRG